MRSTRTTAPRFCGRPRRSRQIRSVTRISRAFNAAACLETTRSPRGLLELLLATERELGRIRDGGRRYGPRTIDLDLLLFGSETVDEPGLRIPHPRLQERRFVLEPLVELDPGLIVPGKGSVAALLAELE